MLAIATKSNNHITPPPPPKKLTDIPQIVQPNNHTN